ncbi:hypothetical protein, partial [Staphylococcus agnetis]
NFATEPENDYLKRKIKYLLFTFVKNAVEDSKSDVFDFYKLFNFRCIYFGNYICYDEQKGADNNG